MDEAEQIIDFKCTECGCTEYEREDGFYYCSLCQLQSQDFKDDMVQMPSNVTLKASSKKVRKHEIDDDDDWTSWDAFNYILYGMTQELKKLGSPRVLEEIALQLWACYLKKTETAFTSRTREEKPRIGLVHRAHDRKVLGIHDFLPKVKPKFKNNKKSEYSTLKKGKDLRKQKKTGTLNYADDLENTIQVKEEPRSTSVISSSSSVSDRFFSTQHHMQETSVDTINSSFDVSGHLNLHKKIMSPENCDDDDDDDDAVSTSSWAVGLVDPVENEMQAMKNSKTLCTSSWVTIDTSQIKENVSEAEENNVHTLSWSAGSSDELSVQGKGRYGGTNDSGIIEQTQPSTRSPMESCTEDVDEEEKIWRLFAETEIRRKTAEENSSPEKKKRKRHVKQCLRSNDYQHYIRAKAEPQKILSIKNSLRTKIGYLSKNKLLAIIHLSLLMANSNIQLGDLIRFIREGHLSYATVTHFLPEDVQIARGDRYIETVSDSTMPTHLGQRKVAGALAKFLSVEAVPLPCLDSLVHRYVHDLNLPCEIGVRSCKVLQWLGLENPMSLQGTSFPNFEGIAMASILFTMKYLFGLDGRTELVISDLAAKLNRVEPKSKEFGYFVFSDWHKHIECRKLILNDYHYPTGAQLRMRGSFVKLKSLLETIWKSFKDERREWRFRNHRGTKELQKFMNNIKKTAGKLREHFTFDSVEFPPSFTPQTTYLDIIIAAYKQRLTEEEERPRDFVYDDLNPKFDDPDYVDIQDKMMDILESDYRMSTIDFAFHIGKCAQMLEQNGYEVIRMKKKDIFIVTFPDGTNNWSSEMEKQPFLRIKTRKGEKNMSLVELNESKMVVVIDDYSSYWRKDMNFMEKIDLQVFNDFVLERLSESFRWFLFECSRMLNMNARDLYIELLSIEDFIIKNVLGRHN